MDTLPPLELCAKKWFNYHMSNSEIFGDIYRNGFWGSGSSSQPLSGSGSNSVNARPYVDLIKRYVEEHSVRTVLDFGHGDWEMWKEWDFQGVDYLGVDVAQGLSEIIQASYGNNFRTFKFHDLSRGKLPHANLLICKDVLQHLPNADIKVFLDECKSFEHAIICNDIYIQGTFVFELKERLQFRRRLARLLSKQNPFFMQRRRNNSDIPAGHFRGIDLEKYPFKDVSNNFHIEILLEFDGPKRPGIRKRVYLLTRKNLTS